jgi:PilZ domain
MPPAEKRKSLRRVISYPAYLDFGDGAPPRECTLCDASQEGAQLQVTEPDSVPDQFVLALSADGAARRKCRVVRRTSNQIGVEFLRDSKKISASPRRRPVPVGSVEPVAGPDAAATPGAQPDPFDIDSLEKR